MSFLGNYEGIISETATIGSPVTITPSPISATDKDFGNNSTISFSFAVSSFNVTVMWYYTLFFSPFQFYQIIY